MIKELQKMKNEVEEMKNEVIQTNEEKSLAMEMLEESKKQHKRDFAEKIILIVILLISNLAWIYYINQFDFSTDTTTLDSGNGNATYLRESNSGDINYGENSK